MKVKRALSALLCSGILMLSVMPVSAGECSHPYWGSETSKDQYQSVDSVNHEIYCIKTLRCLACKYTTVIRESKGTEGHSQGTLADLGHISPRSHKYKIGCTKCGGNSFEVIVPCADH